MNEERSKFYGKAVTNIWNNNPRYGIVRESKIENEWIYLRCTWIDDYLYEKDIERICELRNVERNDQWIRIDKINFLDVKKEISKLSKLSYVIRQLSGEVNFDYYLTDECNKKYAILT